MRIAVFGGLGFMGANFVNWTVKYKPNVQLVILDGFTYAADPTRLDNEMRSKVIRANLMEPVGYKDVIAGCDIVINFAAETHNDNSLKDPEVFIATNVVGLTKLLECCRHLDVPLVQISTDEVFGDFPLDSEVAANEDFPFRPSSPYSASKASGDLLIQAWIRSFGLRAITTHCTNNFGPGQNSEKLIPNVISKIKNGTPIEIYGDGQNVRDWIHVDDHSRAIWLLIEKGTWGESYNISANNFRNNLDVVETIKRACGRPEHPILFVKDRPGHDLKYSLDSSKVRMLGWVPQSTDFELSIQVIVDGLR